MPTRDPDQDPVDADQLATRANDRRPCLIPMTTRHRVFFFLPTPASSPPKKPVPTIHGVCINVCIVWLSTLLPQRMQDKRASPDSDLSDPISSILIFLHCIPPRGRPDTQPCDQGHLDRSLVIGRSVRLARTFEENLIQGVEMDGPS